MGSHQEDRQRSNSEPNMNSTRIVDYHSGKHEVHSDITEAREKPLSFCLFLGDISLFCTEEDLTNAFAVFGDLVDVRIKKNKATKKNLSYGFVEYASEASAMAAIQNMNGKLVCGRILK